MCCSVLSPEIVCTTHISADVQRITLNALYMTISGGRTKQLDIFCRDSGFTSDFLSFIVVKLIWFFHEALQLSIANDYLGILEL